MTTLLAVEGLRTIFQTKEGSVHAVNDVTFSIPSGQLVGLVGETGSGKSATLRSVMGLIRPPGRVVAGEIRLHGQNLMGMPGRQLRRLRGVEMGFVGQNPFGSLHPMLRISAQFYEVIRAHRPSTRTEAYALARAKLLSVGIVDPDRVLNGYAHELSGGMAQRVVIAIAMALDPGLLLLDEPTTALDVTVQRQIMDLITRLLSDSSRAMLLVTHDLGVAAQYCDWVLVMYAGRIVEKGPVRQVFTRPSHPYTSALLAAVPHPGRPLVGLPGTAPHLIDMPDGCAYRNRCSFARERCGVEAPLLEMNEMGHQVACHFPLESEAHRAAAPVA